MATIFNDWLALRMMSAPGGGGSDNIIYELYNYTCDGTAATAINTGIYLFDTTLYPNGWDIYFDFTIVQYVSKQESYLRCRNALSPYPGFSVRRDQTNTNVQIQSNSTSAVVSSVPAGTRLVATIEKTSNKLKVTIGNKSVESSLSSVNSPLVIGGELSNDTTQAWNNTRFSKIIVHSLVVTKKTS